MHDNKMSEKEIWNLAMEALILRDKQRAEHAKIDWDDFTPANPEDVQPLTSYKSTLVEAVLGSVPEHHDDMIRALAFERKMLSDDDVEFYGITQSDFRRAVALVFIGWAIKD